MTILSWPFQPRESPLTPARRWGLLAGGLLTEVNDGGYDSLWFPFGRSRSREYLRGGWSTSNKADLVRIHDWLVLEGHRVPCALDCCHVREMEMGAVPYDPNHPRIKLYRWISSNFQALQQSRLVAWDYSRLVNVARWGYTAGYVDETIAWQWIMEAARAIQEAYSDCTEIGDDFLLGLGGNPAEEQFIEAVKRMREARESPWRTTPWRTHLG